MRISTLTVGSLAIMLAAASACGDGDNSGTTNSATGVGSSASSSTSGGTAGGGGAMGGGGDNSNGGNGAGLPTTCGALLLEEDFIDDNLADRGWTGGVNGAGYSVVNDAALGHNAFEMAFQTGDSTPGGSVRQEFAEAEEITIRYKLRVDPNWDLTVPHHLVMTHSNRDVSEGNGSPANAFGSTYFEFEWNDAGVFIGKFQDNRAINCGYGYQDLAGVTEDRSAGGFQTWFAPPGQDTSSWGDPCENGIDDYTGQSVLTLHANGAAHAMTKDEWWSVAIHLKKNSIQAGSGQWDGMFQVELQGPNDAAPVRVMDFQDVLWRAGGGNAQLAWAKLLLAPYLHNGATQPMWIRIADIRVNEGQCLSR